MDEPVPLRSFLLAQVLRFTLKAAGLPGVSRIALMGSLATSKAVPKDADVLVSVTPDCSLDRLATAARALKGQAQTRNSGADIFLADLDGRYLGRICHWRECRPGIRLACRAQHCGRREFVHDDLQVVNLAPMLVALPPVELWPILVWPFPLMSSAFCWGPCRCENEYSRVRAGTQRQPRVDAVSRNRRAPLRTCHLAKPTRSFQFRDDPMPESPCRQPLAATLD